MNERKAANCYSANIVRQNPPFPLGSRGVQVTLINVTQQEVQHQKRRR